MASRYYPIYQVIGWFLLYASLMLSLRQTFGFTSLEYLFGAVLVGATAFWSHLMRAGYHRAVKDKPLGLQLGYFLPMAMLGGALAATKLFVTVVIFAAVGIIDPIAPGRMGFMFSTIFWGNGLNMWIALTLWSGFYLTLIKTRQLRDTREALASSQLQALEQQLSPHFLFNMLNNIRALILEDPARARESLARLADMLRYSLHRSEQAQVSIAHEFGIVSEYIELCKIQFEDRLQFTWEVPDALMSAQIPRMLLQLCVENAIKHGISQLRDGGTIAVTMRELDGGLLQIDVGNPAPRAVEVTDGLFESGSDDEAVLRRSDSAGRSGLARCSGSAGHSGLAGRAGLAGHSSSATYADSAGRSADQAQTAAYDSAKSSSVGLKNIQQRLALLYGKEMSKQASSLVDVTLTRTPMAQAAQDWVVVRVTLPLVYEK